VKELVAGERRIEHFLDICTLQDRNPVHGRDLEIPWAIATREQRTVRIGKSELFIPEPEPLLVLKLKAAWDRAYDISSGGGTPYLRDKLGKDRFDILSLLLRCDIKSDSFRRLASGDFAGCANDALSRAVSDRAALDRHGLDTSGRKVLNNTADELLSKLL